MARIDEEIGAAVRAAIVGDSRIADLDVEVEAREGIVYLRGEVDEEAQIARATAFARAVTGVADVRNQLVALPLRRGDTRPEVIWRPAVSEHGEGAETIRVAAVADLHCHGNCAGRYRRWFERLDRHADLFVIAGDFTGTGTEREAVCIAAELGKLRVPVLGVFGNHDWHAERADVLGRIFAEHGVTILTGESRVLTVRGQSVGVVGTKGFGGGFGRGLLSAFGEPPIKAWAHEATAEAAKLDAGLSALQTDYRVVVLHYAPIVDTIRGEPPEINPFLGCSRLAEPIDRLGADLVLHGHAHKGTEKGQTAHGIPVRNVAMQVIQRHYALFELRRVSDGASTRPRSPAATTVS